MATYTLTQNEDWSSIKGSIANDDTVALAGYELTLDEEPTLTGIIVTTTATAGTVVIDGAYDISTWSLTAGTGVLIATIPSGCDIGSLTGGSASGARGCVYNYGTITTCTGGSESGAYGCYYSYGAVLGATDDTETAVHEFRGSIKLVDGPNFTSTIVCNASYDPLQTLYVLNGEFAGSLPSDPDPGYDAEIVELFGGGGGLLVHPGTSGGMRG